MCAYASACFHSSNMNSNKNSNQTNTNKGKATVKSILKTCWWCDDTDTQTDTNNTQVKQKNIPRFQMAKASVKLG